MTDYSELIRSLRNCSNNRCAPCDCGWFDKYQVDESCKEIIMWKAADAIEALQAELPKRGEFEKSLHEMFDSIWDCDINHPIFQDTVGELMEAVLQAYDTVNRAKMEVQE